MSHHPAAAAAAAFDRVSAHITTPNVLRYAMLEEQIVAGLHRQIGGVLTAERARSPEVILYVALYLEHALPDKKEGARKKDIAMRVLSPYYREETDRAGLSAVIDFVCARDLVVKTPVLKRLYRVFMRWLEYKLF